MGRTAILILNWNGLALTRACLASLRDAKVDMRDVVLVDNGSTDGSAAAVAAEFPEARVMRLPDNLGYAAGNNVGLRVLLAEARHEHVLLLNNDTLVPPGLLDRLERALDEDARLALAAPKLVFPDGTIESAGQETDRFGVNSPRGRGEPAATTFPAEGVFYASGACLLVRLAALREVELFDEAYFCYHEDIDLTWRLRLAGWGFAYLDDATCVHDESSTAGTAPTKIGVIWRNRFRTLLKDVGPRRVWYVVPAALAMTGVFALGTSLAKKDAAFVRLYARAVWWNARRLRESMRARRRVQATRRARDRDLRHHFARGSIEWRMIRSRAFSRQSGDAGTRGPPRRPLG